MDETKIYEKDDPNKSRNNRPVIVLSVVSKVFEKIMHDQISQYIKSFSTPYLCGYRKRFSTQQALLSAYNFSKESYLLNQKLLT